MIVKLLRVLDNEGDDDARTIATRLRKSRFIIYLITRPYSPMSPFILSDLTRAKFSFYGWGRLCASI